MTCRPRPSLRLAECLPRRLWEDQGQAVQLPKAGVHPKAVSDGMGRASIGITLDTYSHVMPGMQEEAAERIDAGLRAAIADGHGKRGGPPGRPA
jgi:hypothetical protein